MIPTGLWTGLPMLWFRSLSFMIITEVAGEVLLYPLVRWHVPVRLVTGNVTLNLSVALEQCWVVWGWVVVGWEGWWLLCHWVSTVCTCHHHCEVSASHVRTTSCNSYRSYALGMFSWLSFSLSSSTSFVFRCDQKQSRGEAISFQLRWNSKGV